MIEKAFIAGIPLVDGKEYKVEIDEMGLDIVQPEIRPEHPAHAIRIFDENDELDVEVVTDQPHVFSIAFLKEARLITAISIEPIHVPGDKSLS